jgi:hypothetical protein
LQIDGVTVWELYVSSVTHFSQCRMILSLLRVKDFEMEDMMRSSFAEFHLQKEQPEVARKHKEAEATLRRLREKPWPTGPGRCDHLFSLQTSLVEVYSLR